jgi:hypothetical protein
VDTNMADTASGARESTATEMYQERIYPQLDCVGSYLWIWERLIRTDGGTEEIVARKAHRDCPPSGNRAQER